MYVCMPYTGLFHRFLQEERGIFFFCVFKVNRVVNIYIYRLVESFHTSYRLKERKGERYDCTCSL